MFLGPTDLGLIFLGQFAFRWQGDSASTMPAVVHLEAGGKVAAKEAAERARAWRREQMASAPGLLEGRRATPELLAGSLFEAEALYADGNREVVSHGSVRPDTKDA